MIRRLAIGAVAAAALAPASALAATYCVLPEGSCAGPETFPTLQAALTQAAGTTADDEVRLGATTYTAPTQSGFSHSAGTGAVVIAGKGPTTVVTAPAGASAVLSVTAPLGGSVVRDLRVHLPANVADHAVGLAAGVDTERVSVTADPAQSANHRGIQTSGPVAVRNASVVLDNSGLIGATGINSTSGGAVVADSIVTARFGIVAANAAGTVVERVTVTTSTLGIEMEGNGVVRNCVVRVLQAGGNETAIWARNSSPLVSNCTLVGPPPADGNTIGAGATTSAGGTSEPEFSNLVVRGFKYSFGRFTGAGETLVSVHHSDFDASSLYAVGDGNIHLGPGNGLHADAGFLDEAGLDFRLRHSSPLVDAGHPEALTGDLGATDLVGALRLVDGDGSDGARVDIGAHEYPRTPPEAGVSGPAAGAAGTTLQWHATGSDADPGEAAALTYAWAVDGVAAGTGATLAHAFAEGGNHHITLTVTDPAGAVATVGHAVAIEGPPAPAGGTPGPVAVPPAAVADLRAPVLRRVRVTRRFVRFTVDEAGRAVVRITRRGGRKTITRRAQIGAAGAARVPLGRLAPGRYVVTLVVIDAAGNRSRAVRRPLRRRQ